MKLFTVLGAIILFTALSSADNPSGAYKVFGNYYAWNNAWNDPGKVIKSIFGDKGPYPWMASTFNFNKKDLYGYPGIFTYFSFKIE